MRVLFSLTNMCVTVIWKVCVGKKANHHFPHKRVSLVLYLSRLVIMYCFFMHPDFDMPKGPNVCPIHILYYIVWNILLFLEFVNFTHILFG